MKNIIVNKTIGNPYAMKRLREGLDKLDKLGSDIRVTELFEENGGVVCQIYGRMMKIEPLFIVYKDMFTDEFMWSLRKHMKFIPRGMSPCKICNERFYEMYVVEVEGKDVEYVCYRCMEELRKIHSYLGDGSLDCVDASCIHQYPYEAKPNSSHHDFVGYVLFYVENVCRAAVNPIGSLVKLLNYGNFELPTSEHAGDFIDWTKKNETRHYPSWFVRRFLERTRVPVLPSGICEKLLEAALDYVNEKGIEMKEYIADEHLPEDFWQRKWRTKIVTPVDLCLNTITDPTFIEFVGIVDGKFGLFSTRVGRKNLRIAADIVWGVPVKMRFMVETTRLRWGDRVIGFHGKRLLKID